MSSFYGLTLSFVFYFCLDFVAAICYYPDESISPQDVPCSDSEDESNCCGPGYACLSNKVCRQPHQDGDGKVLNYTYGRGSCTDKRWRSSACPSFCILGSSRIVNCDPTQTTESSYCCAAVNGTLTQDGVNGICDCGVDGGYTKPLHFEGNASAITTIDVVASSSQVSLPTITALSKASSSIQSLFPVSAAPASTSSAKSRVIFSTSTSTSPTASLSPSLAPSPSSQLSNKRAVAIGAGVGTPLALIILAFVAYYLHRKISHPSHERSHETGLSSNPDPTVSPSYYHHQHVEPHELFGSTGEHEMQAAPGCYELSGAQSRDLKEGG